MLWVFRNHSKYSGGQERRICLTSGTRVFWKAFLMSRMARILRLEAEVAITIRMESMDEVGEKL